MDRFSTVHNFKSLKGLAIPDVPHQVPLQSHYSQKYYQCHFSLFDIAGHQHHYYHRPGYNYPAYNYLHTRLVSLYKALTLLNAWSFSEAAAESAATPDGVDGDAVIIHRYYLLFALYARILALARCQFART